MNETNSGPPKTELDDRLFKYEELRALQTENQEQFAKLTKTFNADDDSIQDALKKLRHRHKNAGKALTLARERWEELKQTKLGTRQSFPDYFESRYGCRPSNEGYSCARTYRLLVLTEKIRERDYDENPTEAIRWASRILSKINDDADHPAVAEAASILRQRSGTPIKELKALIARLAEEPATGNMKLLNKEQADELNAVPIDYRSASKLASRIAKEGQYWVLAGALEKEAASTPDLQEARELAFAAAKIRASLSNNRDEHGQRRFSDETIAAWMEQAAPARVVTPETMKADYAATAGLLQEKAKKLKEAGIEPPQLTVRPGTAIQNFTPAPEPQSSFDPRWQNAERVVLKWLRSLGWKLVDVSGQKAGCDFKGHNPEGEEVFVDVKSITKQNEPFTMTDGEMLLARQKGAAYQVALLRATETQLQLAFICDPAGLNPKQRFREVYWEFAEYGEFQQALACPLE